MAVMQGLLTSYTTKETKEPAEEYSTFASREHSTRRSFSKYYSPIHPHPYKADYRHDATTMPMIQHVDNTVEQAKVHKELFKDIVSKVTVSSLPRIEQTQRMIKMEIPQDNFTNLCKRTNLEIEKK